MSTEDPRPPDLYQLESAAKDHLDHLVEQFENRLTALAARKAPGRPIAEYKWSINGIEYKWCQFVLEYKWSINGVSSFCGCKTN